MTEPSAGSHHEAAHCAAALVLGIEVTEVRIDRPDDGVPGWCLTPLNGRDVELADLMMTLAGGMIDSAGSSEYELWPPAWPVLRGRGDQGRVRALVRCLGMTEELYWQTVEATHELTRDPVFDQLYRRLAVALQRFEFLGQEEITRIAEPILKTREELTCSI